jgi:hypothetical protein
MIRVFLDPVVETRLRDEACAATPIAVGVGGVIRQEVGVGGGKYSGDEVE